MDLPEGIYSDEGLYSWCLSKTHENQSHAWWPHYIWTPPAKNLLKILEENGDKITFLTGAQGQGKTATLWAVWGKLVPNGIYTKWYNRQSLKEIQYKERIAERFDDEIKTILIDLPDYGTSGQKDISKSLDQIQKYWNDNKNLYNLVITLPEEQRIQHVFLGKGTEFKLEPLPPRKMVEAVHEYHSPHQKPTPTAFNRLAELSGGNFRRFQEYTVVTLDTYPEANLGEITPEMVDQVVTQYETEPHTSRHLSWLFPRDETLKTANAVLEHLKDHGPSNQKNIAQALIYSQKKVGNAVKTLLQHGYVVKRKGNRNENIISLP